MTSGNDIPATPAEARRSHLESIFWRRALLWGLRTFPGPIRRASMPLWSLFFYLQVPHIRRAIESNLVRLRGLSTPRRQAAAFSTFTNYCHCIANAYSVHAGGDPILPASSTGLDHLLQSITPSRGAVLATAHLGNWHLGPYYLSQHGLPQVTVVMGEEPDREVQQMEAALRHRQNRVLYTGESALLGLELRAALSRGELVAFQMDRPSLAGGLNVNCAGGDATFAAGPALLARTCDVAVIPVFFPVERGEVKIIVEAPLHARRTDDRDRDLLRLTQRLAEVCGRMIRRYPDQWFNFYRFWRE